MTRSINQDDDLSVLKATGSPLLSLFAMWTSKGLVTTPSISKIQAVSIILMMGLYHFPMR